MAKTPRPTTMQAARDLRRRHPDATPTTVAVVLALASFGHYTTGADIRPGHAELASIVGVSTRTVRRSIGWLIEREELRQDSASAPGRAASYTWIGGRTVDIQVSHVREANGGHLEANGGHLEANGGHLGGLLPDIDHQTNTPGEPGHFVAPANLAAGGRVAPARGRPCGIDGCESSARRGEEFCPYHTPTD